MENQENLDSFDVVANFFKSFGYKVLEKPNPQENGCDMTVVGKKKCLRVEIKTVRIQDSGGWQALNVTKTQEISDVVAVVLPNNSVFVEKTKEYISLCSDQGYRQFTWLKLD